MLRIIKKFFKYDWAIMALSITGILVMCAVVAVLIATSGPKPEGNDAGHGVEMYTFNSGVTCAVFDTYHAGGIDCDFNHFNGDPSEEKATVNHSELVLFTEHDTTCVTMDGYKSGAISCNW